MASFSWATEAAATLGDSLSKPPVESEPLDVHTTWGVGGVAALMVEATTANEVKAVTEASHRFKVPMRVIGCGSNLLVSEQGYVGIVLRLSGALRDVEVLPEGVVRAGAGARLPRLSDIAAKAGLTGAEFGCGIPGTVGGAVKMNAGAHGADTKSILASATWIDAETSTVHTGIPELGYRSSSIGTGDILIESTFRMQQGDKDAIEDTMAEYCRMRRASQPLGRTAGSVFRNPSGDSAGRLIEAVGAKGLRIGGAIVSDKHANFFLNTDDATPSDIESLINEVSDRVHSEFGVRLQLEVELLGF